jgi:glycosyltransferase involved in cell wall biosynthesis
VRFVIAQMGARRGYAVPLVLEEAGLLERFYTDFAGNVGQGEWLVRIGRLLGLEAAANRLQHRRVPEAIKGKTISVGRPMWWLANHCAARGMNAAGRFRQHLRWNEVLGQAINRGGFGSATHLYSMLDEFGPALTGAKEAGLSVVTEFYIRLSTERIVEKEQRAFAGWEPRAPELDSVRREFADERDLVKLTDFAICPSGAVESDLENEFGFPAHRSAVVPYGVASERFNTYPVPVPGRVLFVGTVGLRKGVHYLALAAEELARRGRQYEFLLAGDVTPRIAKHPACRRLRFLGRIPRNRIAEQFEIADVFVLPSLAEGSAEATYEALAAGAPVITTAAAGSVVRHEVEGLLVPERDPLALANAIERVIQDRRFRAQLAAAGRLRAREYSLEAYGQRLVRALNSFARSP